MHLTSDSCRNTENVPVQDARSLLLAPLELIKGCEAATVTQVGLLEKMVEVLAGHLGRLETSAPLFGLCHGDIHGMNVLFDGEVATLLDFDRLSYGWRAYDLAVFVWWVRGVPEELEVERTVLDGYRSEHPAAERVIEDISIFVPIRHLILTGDIITYAAQGVNVGRWVDEGFFDKRLGFIQRWLEENDLLF